jgi:carboxypeptidase T
MTIAAILACAPSGLAAGPAPALRAGTAVERDCAARALPDGTPGVATSSWTAPAAGLINVKLRADPGSDWDLALIRNGDPVGSSRSYGSIEQASIGVRPGDEVVAQACRRSGHDETATLAFDFFQNPATPPPSGRVSVESVPISGADDLQALDRLGFDVTEDVSDSAASVVLYNDGQRALLSTAGYSSTTMIPDLVASDRADRAAEERAAPAPRASLPSGRTTYRVYDDYANELRNLAEANPALVRPLTHDGGQPGIGLSFEGRPILGVEIAAGVNRTDDGRPVYLNVGAHHAREWPSAEVPMEFAHTLVQGYKNGNTRIMNLLNKVRIIIVPVVNPDGFIASRSYGTTPLDDDADATTGFSVANQAAYIRKNCRPTTPADTAIPCAQRVGSGVDLNRNYGYYWGGPGSSSDTTTQSYRGTGPFSEPESQAIHNLSSHIQPTVFITNHTFTSDGKWLRQPGFDASFLPQGGLGAITPDEPAMKSLGDAMADATGFTSELGYETLGDITGATEDWNYFAQGTYGYTPEARGANFHADYTDMVITEYDGDASHPMEGEREAFLRAGEEAADRDNHGVIQGTAPAGATLKLHKEFVAPTFNQPALNVPEVLDTTMTAPASGHYEWDVMPSDRPQIGTAGPDPDPGDEHWTMTCQRPGNPNIFTTPVEVARNQTVTVDWGTACGAEPPVNVPPTADFDFFPTAPETGQQVNFTSTSHDPDGALSTLEWDLDDDGNFNDATGPVATKTFNTTGSHDVSLRVTDDDGEIDEVTKAVVVTAPANAPPTASFGFNPDPPAPNENVTFTSTSTDSDGNVAGAAWDFDDDGQFDDGAGSVVTRSFPAAQTYRVSLRVTDDDGASSTVSRNVDVRSPVGSGGRPGATGGPSCAGRTATIVGTGRPDLLLGTPGPDVIIALGGRDRVRALGGADVVCGGGGRDRVKGGPGADLLIGGRGADRLNGGAGPDSCRGGRGHDLLRRCP